MRQKLPPQFKLKYTSSVGYWIDGHCGNFYVGYYNTEEEVLSKFWNKYQTDKGDVTDDTNFK